MSIGTLKVRPSAKVRQYILQEFGGMGDSSVKRLPTMRELADRLQVSLATVQTVFKTFSDEGYITTKSGVGSFFNPEPIRSSKRSLNVAITLESAQAGDLHRYWIGGIYAGIIHAIIQDSLQINLIPVGDAEGRAKRFQQLASEGGCDGLLVVGMRSNESESFVEHAVEHGVPFVYLTPPTIQTTSNFVSPDYFQFAQTAGKAFAAAKRRRILYIVNQLMGSGTTYNMPLAGLASGAQEILETGGELRIFRCSSSTGEHTATELEAYIHKFQFFPDAILSQGDYLALEAFKVMKAIGRKVPEEVSIIGTSGLNLTRSVAPGLTRVHHPFDAIGESLMRLLLERIDKKGEDVSSVYHVCEFIGGDTTTPVENALLKISPV